MALPATVVADPAAQLNFEAIDKTLAILGPFTYDATVPRMTLAADLTLRSTVAGTALRLAASADAANYLEIKHDTGGAVEALDSRYGYGFSFRNGGVEKANISNAGVIWAAQAQAHQVGIGHASGIVFGTAGDVTLGRDSAGTLVINGGGAGAGAMRFNRNGTRVGYAYGDSSGFGFLNGAGNWMIRGSGSQAANNTDLLFYVGGVQRASIDSDGFVQSRNIRTTVVSFPVGGVDYQWNDDGLWLVEMIYGSQTVGSGIVSIGTGTGGGSEKYITWLSSISQWSYTGITFTTINTGTSSGKARITTNNPGSLYVVRTRLTAL